MLLSHERYTMQTRSIDARRARPRIGLAAAAMLVVALATCNAVQAQERAAGVQPGAATLVATVQPLDTTYVAPKRASGKALAFPEDGMPQSTAGTPQSTDITAEPVSISVTVSANLPESEPWDRFGHSVAGAARSSCFGPDALPHEEFVVDGLLRLPLLVHAAATSACR
jgi:hypothetical protein